MRQSDEMKQNSAEQILALLKEEGVLRPRDLDAHNIPRRNLSRLYERGLLRRCPSGSVFSTYPVSNKSLLSES